MAPGSAQADGQTYVAMPGAKAAPADGKVNTLTVSAGTGKVVSLPGAAANVFTADPKVVEVRPASPTSLFVFGIQPGMSTVAAMDSAGHPVAQWNVLVQPSAYGATEAGAAIGRALPGRQVRVSSRGDGLVVEGNVATAAEADRAMAAARGFTTGRQTVENRLQVASNTQVTLKVKIAEMDRNVTRELGINWSAMGTIGKFTTGLSIANPLLSALLPASAAGASFANKGVSIDSVIQALSQDNLIHILAEPTLTAMSGETASFLVGGEFPIPIASTPSGNTTTITVDFKQYGVSLAFVPTVLSNGQINLKVRPEVSSLTNQGAVQLSTGNGTLSIPALTVRRADTTVELGSGQSFAIAGLLQDQATLQGNGFPWLGDIPILGALFRSDGFQRDETELVIIVTPYISQPVSDGTKLSSPTDGWSMPGDSDRILRYRQTGTAQINALSNPPKAAPATATGRYPGTVPFVVQ